MGTIQIRGARQNNLKNIDVAIPREALTVVTGVSGSGKSSLAFDVLYAEGQRRYVESFSTYARQFLERMDRPDVDAIDGLLPAVALEQRNTIRSSRSTLATLTELLDYLKILFAKLADLHCPTCGAIVVPDHPVQVVERLLESASGRRGLVAFPFVAGKGEAGQLATRYLQQQGFRRVVRGGKVEDLDLPGVKALSGRERVLVDRLVVRAEEKSRLVEAIETAYRLGDGAAVLLVEAQVGAWNEQALERDRRHCGQSFDPPSEGMFSFNSPIGACEACKGFGRVFDTDMDRVVPDVRKSLARGAIEPWSTPARGAERKALRVACEAAGIDMDLPFGALSEVDRRYVIEGAEGLPQGAARAARAGAAAKGWSGVRGWFRMLGQKTYKMHVRILLAHYRSYVACSDCAGTRMKPPARWYRLGGRTLPEVLAMTVAGAKAWVEALPDGARARALLPVTTQIAARLGYLERVGIGYLTLDRQARTLSGGEVQRANLTTTLGSGLVNTLFVLDEPTVGLHAADAERLADVLAELVRRENTVVVVEHDPDMLRVADDVLELGPGPGRDGGQVVYSGPPDRFDNVPGSPTLAALARLAKPRTLPTATRALAPGAPRLVIRNARGWNLKGVTAEFPVGALSVITGVSGSGKSTLLEDVLYRNVLRREGQATDTPGACDAIEGLEHFREVVWVDQTPPVASSRAIPVTYVGAWDYFRQLFARAPLAKARGYTATTFSFNTGEGRCPACEGAGVETIEMQFLADVTLKCEVCKGKRFRPEVLEVECLGKTVAEVLDLTVDEAVELARERRPIVERLSMIRAVGLGYLKLGQPLSTLSGGEAQRLKLAGHLASEKKGTLFLLDEPTTGLHLQDVTRLIGVLAALVARGHTVLCIEHHLDVIAAAQHVVDFGPGGGDAGGEIIFSGPPGRLVNEASATGEHLRRWLGGIAPLARKAKAGTATGTGVAERRRTYTRRAQAGDGVIAISGARTHNLQSIDVTIPRRGRTVVSGVSGSGKSTLVFDIVFAEGQRRFLDCLSSYARQFIGEMGRPDADRIEGIPPTVAIEQRTTRGGSRSSVANVTEIEPFLRILWARLGQIPGAGVSGGLTVDALHTYLLNEQRRGGAGRQKVHVAAPIVQARQGLHLPVLKRAAREGFRVVVNGVVAEPESVARLRKRQHHDIDFVIGTAAPNAKEFRGLLEEAARLGKGQVKVLAGEQVRLFQVAAAGQQTARSEAGFDPRYFSARTALGRCERCEGWGRFEDGETCDECGGCRLGPIGRSVTFGGMTFPQVLGYTAPELMATLDGLPLDVRARAVADGALRAIRERVDFLQEVGLGYLALNRGVRSLSGGEAQRIRLAAQLGAHLSGVLYVLDEPTIGLHPTDTERLLETLDRLEARGNGILMVEHDEATLRSADVLIDIGPGAGVEGGRVLAQGPVAEVLKAKNSITGQWLAHPRGPSRAAPRDVGDAEWLGIQGIRHHTLTDIDVRIPRGRMTVITGVSGSGKSSLVEVLTKAVVSDRGAGEWRKVAGTAGLTTLVEIDDQPIGKNPRSTPATYVGVWDDIRSLFAALPEAKIRGYSPGRFSFNVAGGRCEACAGAGLVTLEMSFLPEAYVACGVCGGARFSRQTLQVLWEGKSIHDVLQLPVREALKLFERVPAIKQKLELLDAVGLGYLTLGQPSPTLSGGEAQRIKLVTHLAGRGQPKTLLILDEPSIGLHMADVPRLLEVLHRLVDKGATVVVVEHNPDIMREADWLIDMGPGPGNEGGRVVYQGPYAGLLEVAASRTGQYLAARVALPSKAGARLPTTRTRATLARPEAVPRAAPAARVSARRSAVAG